MTFTDDCTYFWMHFKIWYSSISYSNLAAQTVWDIQVSSQNPHHLFSCSDDGSLLHWNTNPRRAGTQTSFNISSDQDNLQVTDISDSVVWPITSLALTEKFILGVHENHNVFLLDMPRLPWFGFQLKAIFYRDNSIFSHFCPHSLSFVVFMFAIFCLLSCIS